MRRVVLSGLTVGALLAWAGTAAGQGIAGSAHDFSAQSWNTSGQICIVCHTPHNGNTSVTNAPLWNHALTTATFTPYSSATLTATVGQPNGISKLCLSCHDGTVAIDSYGGATGSTTIPVGDVHNLGTDLSNDHPVSFTYNTALATSDGGLRDPATATGIGTGTIQNTMLFTNQVECASCHDAHNKAGINPLLRKSNAGSGLCLTCHSK